MRSCYCEEDRLYEAQPRTIGRKGNDATLVVDAFPSVIDLRESAVNHHGLVTDEKLLKLDLHHRSVSGLFLRDVHDMADDGPAARKDTRLPNAHRRRNAGQHGGARL